MLSKLSAILLFLCISVQSFGVIPTQDGHHGFDNVAHDLFHHMGQPHSHDADDNTQFDISYSSDAMDHSSPSHDGGSVGIVMLDLQTIPDALPNQAILSWQTGWEQPFLRYTTPPPKA